MSNATDQLIVFEKIFAARGMPSDFRFLAYQIFHDTLAWVMSEANDYCFEITGEHLKVRRVNFQKEGK